ncbi:methionyl-tRNA synthetase, partial [Kipferlia bialata]
VGRAMVSTLVGVVADCDTEKGLIPEPVRATVRAMAPAHPVIEAEQYLDCMLEALGLACVCKEYRLPEFKELQDTYYVTTPIYYVNGVPHIGHVYSTMLADVCARWARLRGIYTNVVFQTGTDEHGQKVQQTAEGKGIHPKELADQISAQFKACFDAFEFSYDRFIRTTDADHLKTVHNLWNTLQEKGLIHKDKYEGWYCVSDEAFVTDRGVTDGMFEGKPCKVTVESNRPVIRIEEEGYMFKLSQFGDRLIDFFTKHPNVIEPAFRQREIIAFIKRGLRDLSISRPKAKITWGLPVPGDDDHVVSV